MIECGFEDRPGDPEAALDFYKRAHKLGNTDASINIAMYHLNGINMERDPNMGKHLLKYAYKAGNDRAIDYLISFGFIRSRKEIEAEMINVDEELVSQMAQSSTGFLASKRNNEAIQANASANWGRTSVDEAAGQRSSMRSITNS